MRREIKDVHPRNETWRWLKHILSFCEFKNKSINSFFIGLDHGAHNLFFIFQFHRCYFDVVFPRINLDDIKTEKIKNHIKVK